MLRLKVITTIESASRYLAESYRAEHNAQFAVAPAEKGTAFVPFVGDTANILCAKHEGAVGDDNCVRLDRRSLQIPEQHHRQYFVRVAINVHSYPDSNLAVFHGPRKLAGYTADGMLIVHATPTQSTA